MRKVWIEHIVSMSCVLTILILLVLIFNNQQKLKKAHHDIEIEKWLSIEYLDFDSPMHQAILEESLNFYDSTSASENAELLSNIKKYRQQQVIDASINKDLALPLDKEKLASLAIMYGKFVLVYLIAILITFYGVQTLGTYRYILHKRNQLPYTLQLVNHIRSIKFTKWNNLWQDYYPVMILFFKAVIKAIAYFVLFSPAYVLAYSIRTKFGTDMLFFMVILGVISNAMLITYSNKFFTFLVTEGRKGYVLTAIVKNMKNSYKFGIDDGIDYKNLLSLNKVFPGHVLNHIYQNAHMQYFSTIKEQASFLITGLIIIEMALNIQNHLCYELLQNILYANYAVVTLIVLAIYVLVKSTEICVDYFSFRLDKRFSNYTVD